MAHATQKNHHLLPWLETGSKGIGSIEIHLRIVVVLDLNRVTLNFTGQNFFHPEDGRIALTGNALALRADKVDRTQVTRVTGFDYCDQIRAIRDLPNAGDGNRARRSDQ